MAKTTKNMTIEELVAGEKAATVVRRYYEDRINMFRGIDIDSITETERTEVSEMSQKLAFINSIRLKIIKEMETRLTGIE